jgi:SAM-dependent methyltransferase
VPGRTRYNERQLQAVLDFGGVEPQHRILEVGCGMGRFTLLLAERGYAVEGLDLTPRLLEELRQFNAGRHEIPLHCADLRQPVPELLGRFDRILGFFTLHHMRELERCFASAYAMLKPGGRVTFVEPNAWNPLFYLQIMLTPGMTWQGDGGVAQMRRAVVLPALAQAGFTDLALERFGFFPPALANHRAGAAIEARLEALSLLRPILPFQLFRGSKRA